MFFQTVKDFKKTWTELKRGITNYLALNYKSHGKRIPMPCRDERQKNGYKKAEKSPRAGKLIFINNKISNKTAS